MNKWRRRTDAFLYKVKKDMIHKEDAILELATGINDFLCVMFQDYDFIPTDKDVYPGSVPGLRHLDAENFGSSALIREMPHWDAIFFCESLEHCAHPWLVFKEAYNHLNRGGFFVVTAPCYYPIHEGMTGKGPGHVEIKDYWRVTPNGLAQLFRDAYFQTYYVEELHVDRDLPASQPYSVVGWGQRSDVTMSQKQVTTWNPELPEDWVEQHITAEERWQKTQKES
jgi:SAM-dependent methyltransferase